MAMLYNYSAMRLPTSSITLVVARFIFKSLGVCFAHYYAY